MTEKHTPGPWIAREKTNPDCNEGTHYITCADGALGYWRGHKQGHADSNWVLNKADAQLIAAAPDLLSALTELMASAGEHITRESDKSLAAMLDEPDCPDEAKRQIKAFLIARATVAKATGDAP